MVAARDLVGIPVWQQIIGPWRAFLSALIMVLAIVPLEARLETAEPFTSTLVGLLLVVVTGAIVYIVSMFLLWRVAGSPDSFEATFFKPLSGYVRRILK
jgi:PST family polysaccharide transporter